MDIRLEAITKFYKDADNRLLILNTVDFKFEAGKAFAIVGPSGIGKSTLLNVLAGLDKPSNGAVWYGASNISKMSEDQQAQFRGAHVGFVFQFHHLLPEFTALENVAMPLSIAGVSNEKAQAASKEVLLKVGLAERLLHRPSQLSGGEQQRVAIARAVVHKPQVLLADEPTGNLDVNSAGQIRDLIRGLQKEIGSLLICVTHSRELAASMDHTLEMQPGGALLAK